LEESNPVLESPKEFGGNPYHSFILTNNETACEAASAVAESAGLKSMILSTMFDGDSRELGKVFAAVAGEVRMNHRPLKPPCALVGGGETIVSVNRNFGKGGPNQEFVVSTILNMREQDDFVVVGLDTDGTDGPTAAAGAIGDATTAVAAVSGGMDLHRSLENHKVLPVLSSLNEIIITGQTGTNVNDLKILIVA
jgi:glycerate-2-kinase